MCFEGSCPHLFHSAFALSDKVAEWGKWRGSVLDRSVGRSVGLGVEGSSPSRGSNSLTGKTDPTSGPQNPSNPRYLKSYYVPGLQEDDFGLGTRVTWDDRFRRFPGPVCTLSQDY